MLSEALRLIRVFHDMKQGALAERLGISKSHLSEIESNKKTPSLALIDRYSEVFNIPKSSILFFSENLDTAQPVENTRTMVSSKIISLLDFIAKRSGGHDAEEA